MTGGLGLHTAIGLARQGADLVVTARDAAKADDAVGRIGKDAPGAKVDVVSLDLADLADTKRAAAEVAATYDRIDILVNNAGIMCNAESRDQGRLRAADRHQPPRALRVDGRPVAAAGQQRRPGRHGLVARPQERRRHRPGRLTPEGSPGATAAGSRTASPSSPNLLFALELDRRAKAAGSPVVSVAAHPGYASTNLTKTGPSVNGLSLPGIGMHQISKIIGQPAAHGAWPLLMAATDPALTGGEYVGPVGIQRDARSSQARRHDPDRPRRDARRRPVGGVGSGRPAVDFDV